MLGLLMPDGGTWSPQSYELWSTSIARPTTRSLSQWSLYAMIPRMVFRNLHVPMMILDPPNDRDVFPVTDSTACANSRDNYRRLNSRKV